MPDSLQHARQLNLAVVVVTHDSASWLPAFFASWDAALRQLDGQHLPIFTLLIADSGSSDHTLQLAAQRPGITVLDCGNIGYGAAGNRAIHTLPEEVRWVLLCNPDLTFPRNFLQQIVVIMQALSAADVPAIIGPQLLNPDGSVQPSVGAFPSIRRLVFDQFRARQNRKYLLPQPAAAGNVDWLSGACLLLNRALFEDVAGFDERYFLYVEEVDLQRRLRDAGHAIRFEPALQVIHHAPHAQRAPSPAVQRWAAAGTLRYFAKFANPVHLFAYRLLALLSGRLPAREAFASRKTILQRSTGP